MRIKFYSKIDLSCRSNLEEAKKRLDDYDLIASRQDINDLLEIYNIKLFFDNDLPKHVWSDEEIDKYKCYIRKIPQTIRSFFTEAKINDIDSIYFLVDFQYKDNFWSVIADYKLYDQISPEKILSILSKDPGSISYILRHKSIVFKFDAALTSMLTYYAKTAELLLDQYAVKYRDDKMNLIFPSGLTNDLRAQILLDYTNCDTASINYLKILYTAKKLNDFNIDVRIRLRAKRKYDEKLHLVFDGGITFPMRVFVSLREQEEPFCLSFDDKTNTISYSCSSQWLEENLDFPTILNNFIYIFGYTNLKFLCSFISNSSKRSVIEQAIGLHGRNDYETGTSYTVENMLASAQMRMYYGFLSSHNIQLEEVFKWFFESYIAEEFGKKGFHYTVPSKNSTIYEKCLVMISQLEAIIKQFRLYVDDGFIDRELFEFSSNACKISDTPSLHKKKYAYAKSQELKYEMYLMYSNQCILSYCEKSNESFDSFYELLTNIKIKREGIADYNISDLGFLLSRGTIFENADGFLEVNYPRHSLIKDLYYKEVIACSYVGNAATIFKQLVDADELLIEGTLFSRPEQEYLDFMLNVQKFGNGPEIRNKYAHGTNSLDPKIQENDYFELLKIMVIIIIKINEEFCI